MEVQLSVGEDLMDGAFIISLNMWKREDLRCNANKIFRFFCLKKNFSKVSKATEISPFNNQRPMKGLRVLRTRSSNKFHQVGAGF